MVNPRVVFVDVFVDDPNTDPPQFRVVPSVKNEPDQLPTNPNPENPGQPEIVFHNNGHQGFHIHFELKGDTHGYFFPSQSEILDAVWSERGSACPDRERIHQIFQPLRVEQTGNPPERRILIVHNRNPGPRPGQRKFKYNLRVTNGQDWKNLDPPGDNTNGSYKASGDYLLLGGVGVTAGVLSALVTTFALTRFAGLVCPGAPGF